MCFWWVSIVETSFWNVCNSLSKQLTNKLKFLEIDPGANKLIFSYSESRLVLGWVEFFEYVLNESCTRILRRALQTICHAPARYFERNSIMWEGMMYVSGWVTWVRKHPIIEKFKMVISHFKPKMRSLLREYDFRIRNKQRHQATRHDLEIFFALSFLSHTVLLPLGLTREWDTGFEFAFHDFVENLLRQDSDSEWRKSICLHKFITFEKEMAVGERYVQK